ncbi:hypothetical protein [Pedobacter miscanthi]|uniref:hypothetical protein n=1 Tax=Pedobacter miscanthi TaxID=2259170 RepID=UPI0011BDB612|nr:hypothetical protein [Pedobacter miscanthi]
MARAIYSPTGNLLDWTSNGSVCVSPNQYALRTGNSHGNCIVTAQGSGTKWLYTKISCPLDDNVILIGLGLGALEIIFIKRKARLDAPMV